jgi:hypothetical protein
MAILTQGRLRPHSRAFAVALGRWAGLARALGYSRRFVVVAVATGKAAEVAASLRQFNVGNVVNGLAVVTAAHLFAVCSPHGLMLPRATEPSARLK